MTKKIKKLAVIRTDESKSCPFGLEIPYGCQNAGELIHHMAPLNILGEDSTDEEKLEIAEANNHLFMWKNPQERCPYARKLFPDHGAVECSWDNQDAADGALRGSQFFYRPFHGVGLDGLYNYPLGWYQNDARFVHPYYGPYSIESIAKKLINDFKENDDETKEK